MKFDADIHDPPQKNVKPTDTADPSAFYLNVLTFYVIIPVCML